MEKLESGEDYLIMKDFAHSPSKLKATTRSVKEQFPNRRLVACMELHTFSSLNAEFLGEYKDAMQAADEAVVFFSKKALEHKKLPPISEEEVKAAFNQPELKVISEEDVVQRYLNNVDMRNTNLLLMSSGNFGGIDLAELASSLVEK